MHRRWFSVLLVATLLGIGWGGAAARTPTPAPAIHRTSNGILLQAGLPLPVYRIIAPFVNADKTLTVAQLFEGIGSTTVFSDTYNGGNRFTVASRGTGALLERYGASGGFFAYKPGEVAGETVRGTLDVNQTQYLACIFLQRNQLLPDNRNIQTPATQSCDFDPQTTQPYSVTRAVGTEETINGTTTIRPTTLAAWVRVPLSLNTGRFAQIPSVPLGGAGGHISLMFSTTNIDSSAFSLDSSVPGLVAAALPFYDRTLQQFRNVPTRDLAAVRAEVVNRVSASYPTATVIVPVPALVYDVDDAASVQRVLEPVFNFANIQVVMDGKTTFIRDINVPAAEGGSTGFGPSVEIMTPADNATYQPGAPTTLQGSVGEGTAPYTYTWSLEDGTVLQQETVPTGGPFSITTNVLPVAGREGTPVSTLVRLAVEDSTGARRMDEVRLRPVVAPAVYLPFVRRGGGAALAASGTAPAQSAGVAPLEGAAGYTFGIEAGNDYPPYGTGGSDLPGVVPDANGFRSGMQSFGWRRIFDWRNATAWERDWRDCSLGGGDCSFGVDRADWVYYAGHGGPGFLALPSNNTSPTFSGSNARFQNARWVGFASCQTLRAQWSPASAAPIRQWFNAFQGAHMLLGFNSNMADVPFGGRLVDNMRPVTFLGLTIFQRTIREAWVLTAFQMNAGKPAYIYAINNVTNPVNEKLPGPNDQPRARPFPAASYHWVWWDE